MSYAPDRHHRRSIRLRGYDYSQAGAYFVTLRTWRGECLFGEVVAAGMALSAYGQVVVDEWLATPAVRHEIELDAFVVMPNHMHAVVRIISDDAFVVGATGRSPLLQNTPGPPRGPAPRSLGAFMAGFKSAVTTRINRLRNAPGAPVWQRNYYEHIIRDDELDRIRQYIADNPARWSSDRHNPLVTTPGVDEFPPWR